jgi:hypothetical protein
VYGGRPTTGSKVSLSTGFAAYGDASSGPLAPGDVGDLVEDDGSSKPFKVEYGGKTWWYKAEAIVLASAATGTRPAVGSKVTVSASYRDHGDAASGPLAVGGVGVLLEDDGSGKPYKVEAAGTTWWYKAEAIVAAGDGSAPPGRPTVGSRVVLTSSYTTESDASAGPLEPGLVGTVVEDDGSGKPFKVEYGGKGWWYKAEAVRLAPTRDSTSSGGVTTVGVGATVCVDAELASCKAACEASSAGWSGAMRACCGQTGVVEVGGGHSWHPPRALLFMPWTP